ncbi:MFS transporter [Streptomyces rubiginosohelvolus]
MSPQTDEPKRVFRRFYLATTVSGAGSAVTLVALPLTAVSTLDSTPFQVSSLAAAGQAGWLLLGLPAGVIVQRFPLRAIQIWMDLFRLVAIGSIPTAWSLDALTYPHLLAAMFIVGLATVLADISNATYLPAIIDTDHLHSRNSLISGTQAVTQTGGPSLAGLLIQLGGAAGALVIDALSYLISALALSTLPERSAPSRTSVPAITLIKEGWTFVTRHPVMRPCLLWATATNFATGALMALMPTYLVRYADLPAGVVGVVVAVDGLGALIGAMLATKLTLRFGSARALLAASAIGAAFTLMTPLTIGLYTAWLFGLGIAGFAAGVVIGSILTRTHRQTASPPELLSRVMATVRFVSWGALPLGALLSGVAAQYLGLHTAQVLIVLCTFVSPAVLLLSPLRSMRDLADEHSPATSPAP